MQRQSSKLGLLCHSASLGSLQRRTVNTRASGSPRTYGARVSKGNLFKETLHGFLEGIAPAQIEDTQAVVRKGGLSVMDRAANWAHAKPRGNRRVPPQGIPQLSVKKILSTPLDILADEIFNTDIGDQVLPKGSFLEVRRSVSVDLVLFSPVNSSLQKQRSTSRSRHGPILLWSYPANPHSHHYG